MGKSVPCDRPAATWRCFVAWSDALTSDRPDRPFNVSITAGSLLHVLPQDNITRSFTANPRSVSHWLSRHGYRAQGNDADLASVRTPVPQHSLVADLAAKMGCGMSTEEKEGKQRNEEIENQLKRDKMSQRNEIKMLLLGAILPR